MKKLNVKKILETAVPAAIVGIAGGAIYFIGYNIGWADRENVIMKGVEICWAQDPTLKEHMMNVAMDVNGKL